MAGSRRVEELSRLAMASFEVPLGPLVVALSGGADSAACAWLATRTSDQVRAVHVNHGLAGSPVMEGAAFRVAGQLGIDIEVLTVEVGSGPSLEAQARTARYEALEKAITPDETILIAHTADDQAETVLLNLLRGSGVDGLSGMPRFRPPFLRPLLDVQRSTVRELASLCGLAWHDDPSNRDLRLLRNRIRRQLIPVIESGYSASIRESLVRTASLLASTREYLDSQTDLSSIERSEQEVRFPASVVATMPSELQGRFLRAAWRMLVADHPPLRAAVHSMMAVVAGACPAIDLEGGLTVRRSGPMVLLERSGPRSSPPPIEVTFPGTARWDAWRFEMALSSERPVVPLSPLGIVLGVPADLTTLVIGAATRGDRIAIVNGSKPVFEALAEAGVPVELRPRWPVVRLDDVVVWVPGVRRAVWAAGVIDRYLCAIAVEEDTWET